MKLPDLNNSAIRSPKVRIPLVAHAPVEESTHARDIIVDVLGRLGNEVNIPKTHGIYEAVLQSWSWSRWSQNCFEDPEPKLFV